MSYYNIRGSRGSAQSNNQAVRWRRVVPNIVGSLSGVAEGGQFEIDVPSIITDPSQIYLAFDVTPASKAALTQSLDTAVVAVGTRHCMAQSVLSLFSQIDLVVGGNVIESYSQQQAKRRHFLECLMSSPSEAKAFQNGGCVPNEATNELSWLSDTGSTMEQNDYTNKGVLKRDLQFQNGFYSVPLKHFLNMFDQSNIAKFPAGALQLRFTRSMTDEIATFTGGTGSPSVTLNRVYLNMPDLQPAPQVMADIKKAIGSNDSSKFGYRQWKMEKQTITAVSTDITLQTAHGNRPIACLYMEKESAALATKDEVYALNDISTVKVDLDGVTYPTVDKDLSTKEGRARNYEDFLNLAGGPESVAIGASEFNVHYVINCIDLGRSPIGEYDTEKGSFHTTLTVSRSTTCGAGEGYIVWLYDSAFDMELGTGLVKNQIKG